MWTATVSDRVWTAAVIRCGLQQSVVESGLQQHYDVDSNGNTKWPASVADTVCTATTCVRPVICTIGNKSFTGGVLLNTNTLMGKKKREREREGERLIQHTFQQPRLSFFSGPPVDFASALDQNTCRFLALDHGRLSGVPPA